MTDKHPLIQMIDDCGESAIAAGVRPAAIAGLQFSVMAVPLLVNYFNSGGQVDFQKRTVEGIPYIVDPDQLQPVKIRLMTEQ